MTFIIGLILFLALSACGTGSLRETGLKCTHHFPDHGYPARSVQCEGTLLYETAAVIGADIRTIE